MMDQKIIDIEHVHTEELSAEVDHLNLTLQNYPYLVLNIQEFSGHLLTTNQTLPQSTTRLVIARQFLQGKSTRSNMTGFMMLRPSLPGGCAALHFSPTPLPSLDTLSFSLHTPDGKPYVAEQHAWNRDNMRIRSIGLRCQEGIHLLDLYVEPVFHTFLYEIGDLLEIRSFRFLDAPNRIAKDMSPLQHRILDCLGNGVHITAKSYTPANDAVVPGFCNRLSVPLPDIMDPRTGIRMETPLTSCIWTAGGCILNRSIQPVITLCIECDQPELERVDLELM